MDRIKLAKEILKRYELKHKDKVRYRGISVSEFDREELLKIVDMYAELIANKDRTVDALLLRVGF